MAKRSRRVRRQETEKQRQFASPPMTSVELPAVEAVEDEFPLPMKAAQAAPINNRKVVNFAQEYYYVYPELRNIMIITAILFVVMIGLSFVIS